MNLKKSILLVNVCITVLIIWMLGLIVYTWASNLNIKSDIQPTSSNATQSQITTAVSTKDLKDFRLIVKKDIFNTLEDTSGASAVNRAGSNAKETNLNLKLRGTAVGENNISYAIIFDGRTGKEELYERDDTIQGARIQEILTDKVILNINGREEALLLPVESEGVSRNTYRRPPTREYVPPRRTSRQPRKIKRPPKISQPKATVKPPIPPASNEL